MPTNPPPRPRKARPGPGPRPEGGPWSSGHHRRHAPAFPWWHLPAGLRWRPAPARPAARHSHHVISVTGPRRPLAAGVSTVSVHHQSSFSFSSVSFLSSIAVQHGEHVQDAVRAAVYHVRPEPARRKRIRRGECRAGRRIAKIG